MVEKHKDGKGERGIKDSDSEVNLAVAIYLATYLDLNDSTKAYYMKHGSDKRFYEFFANELLEQSEVPENFQKKMQSNFEAYKLNCKRICNGDTKK